MKKFLHKLAHLFGHYGGHPVHFTFSALPRAEWFSGFRCAKCGTISMVEPKKTEKAFDDAVMRLWDETRKPTKRSHCDGY